MPICKGELHEIDTLLEADGDADVEAKSAYQPMVKWYADKTVGNPIKPTSTGRIVRMIGVAFLVLYLGMTLVKSLAG
jgi:hypothetical protein